MPTLSQGTLHLPPSRTLDICSWLKKMEVGTVENGSAGLILWAGGGIELLYWKERLRYYSE